MDYESLQDLYNLELKELYGAEKEIHRMLPKMIKQATTSELKETLERHRELTRIHVERLEAILSRHHLSARHVRCKGMMGILDECLDWLEVSADPVVMDAGLIAMVQRTTHFQIASYGCTRTYATLLTAEDDAELLNLSLHEEKIADRKFTDLAETANADALHVHLSHAG